MSVCHCLVVVALLLTCVRDGRVQARGPTADAVADALWSRTLGQEQSATYEGPNHSSSRRTLAEGTVAGATNATSDLDGATAMRPSERLALLTKRPLIQPPSLPEPATVLVPAADPPSADAATSAATIKGPPPQLAPPGPVCPCADAAKARALPPSPPEVPPEPPQPPCPQLPAWTGVSRMQILACDLAAPQADVCG